MKYALAFSAVCLIVVLTHQQCAVYQNSGIKGLSKLQDQDNICANLLSTNDLAYLTDLKINLEGNSETISSEVVDICSVKLDGETVAVCKTGLVFKQSILDKGENEVTIKTTEDHEYTYYVDESSDKTKIHMYISSSKIPEFDVNESKGLICTGVVEEDEIQNSMLFHIATTILDNIWHHIKSLKKDENSET